MNNSLPTIIIGLTGGIGSGKSTAESFCNNKGIITADSDKWVHEILKKNKTVIHEITNYFIHFHGINPALNSGELDRKLIASIAFKNKKTIKFLEQLIHPIVKQKSVEWIIKQRDNNVPMAVIIVPLLLESNMSKIVDVVVVIASKEKIRKKRLKEHRGWTDEQILLRIENQFSEKERIKQADYIVENNNSIEEFKNNFYSVLNTIEKTFN
ncbi:MAG: dephospho-CoA kinase [Chlamydiae bacterium]|nr:MAG: dephospho-CoA kinase [Chlamydiota bacterium]